MVVLVERRHLRGLRQLLVLLVLLQVLLLQLLRDDNDTVSWGQCYSLK
jgi:hypothetical protein